MSTPQLPQAWLQHAPGSPKSQEAPAAAHVGPGGGGVTVVVVKVVVKELAVTVFCI
jgi:hypothetical protein